jgi:hypothetical protein
MTTDALIDEDVASVFYLAFDLMLAEAPIRDGAVQIQESRLANAGRDDPAAGSRLAAVRAALLKSVGAGFASLRNEEIERANTLARRAGLGTPVVPDDEVRTLTLHRDRPTPLD